MILVKILYKFVDVLMSTNLVIKPIPVWIDNHQLRCFKASFYPCEYFEDGCPHSNKRIRQKICSERQNPS